MQHVMVPIKMVPIKRSAATFAICTILAALATPAAQARVGAPVLQDQKQDQKQDSKKDPGAKPKSQSGNSLTGCVDEQQGHYVLVDERSLNPIADLVADGFPTEGFAKHVGHKVTVRGTSNSDGARQILKVRSIEMISEVCAPKEPQPVKP
jgi:hypothetical protein